MKLLLASIIVLLLLTYSANTQTKGLRLVLAPELIQNVLPFCVVNFDTVNGKEIERATDNCFLAFGKLTTDDGTNTIEGIGFDSFAFYGVTGLEDELFKYNYSSNNHDSVFVRAYNKNANYFGQTSINDLFHQFLILFIKAHYYLDDDKIKNIQYEDSFVVFNIQIRAFIRAQINRQTHYSNDYKLLPVKVYVNKKSYELVKPWL